MSDGVDTVLTVRPAAVGDAAAVADLVRQLGYERSLPEVAAWIDGDDLREGRQVCFVACVEGEVMGWVEASVERRLQTPPFAFVGGLVVREGFRGRRVGQRLCEEVERWARGLGLSAVRLTSRSTRTEAHRFYQRNGYRQVKTSLVFEKALAAEVD